MKKRAIIEQIDDLRRVYGEDMANLDVRLIALRSITERMAEIDDLASKLAWLEARVDLLFARCEAMRGDITLDDAAAQRLTFAVGQFSARLDRLEQPPSAAKPRGRPRKQRPQMPAGPNGEAERTQPPPTTTNPTGGPPNDPEQPADPRAPD
jgi:hypothetical protein